MDHQVARLFSVTHDAVTELRTLHGPAMGSGHIHHKAGTPGPGHVEPALSFLTEVTAAIAGAREILIAGPGHAKFALKRHLEHRAPEIDMRVLGVEPMDKAGREELHAFANLFFRQKDLFRGPGITSR